MISVVVISPDDSEGVVLVKVMNLHIVIRSDCFGPGICLVLAKEMEVAKDIRSDDKKRVKTGVKTPIVRRSGWGPGGCLPFWGRRCKEGGPAAGAMAWRGWLRRAMVRRQLGGI